MRTTDPPTHPTPRGNMLARDYTNVGSKGFILEAWTTEEIVGDIGSIGSAQDGAITISDKSGTVQVMVPSYVLVSVTPAVST